MSVLCPLVSVILPIRDEAPSVEETLRAVLAQDYPREQLEVLAVDGMSGDGTRDIVQRLAGQDPRLRMLDNPKRITPAALNLGIRAARGDVIIRVDGHGVVPPSYVRECVEMMGEMLKVESRKQKAATSNEESRKQKAATSNEESRKQKAEMGTVRPPDDETTGLEDRGQWSVVSGLPSVFRPLAVGGAWDCVGRGTVGAAIALATSSRFGVGGSRYRTCSPEKQPVPTDSVPFWAMPREVFERIGLFREEMLCHEDYEFSYRLRRAGGMILLLPWLRSKYYVRSTLGSLARQYWRYGVWKGRFLCSYPGSLAARHLVPPVFVAALLITLVAALAGTAGQISAGILLGTYLFSWPRPRSASELVSRALGLEWNRGLT